MRIGAKRKNVKKRLRIVPKRRKVNLPRQRLKNSSKRQETTLNRNQ